MSRTPTTEITNFFPAIDKCVALDASDLASFLLQYLLSKDGGHGLQIAVVVHNVEQELTSGRGSFELRQAVLEAYAWLEHNGLVGYDPKAHLGAAGICAVTRKGRQAAKESSFEGFKRSDLFSSEIIHRRIQEKAWTDFMKGDYDSAVFKAFQEIEHRVRELVLEHTGNAVADDLIGVALMRNVFHPDTGALTFPNDARAERESLAHLFAGAIGLGKNPHSHRRVGLRNPVEAVRLIGFASYLLNLAEMRPVQLDFKDADFSEPSDFNKE